MPRVVDETATNLPRITVIPLTFQQISANSPELHDAVSAQNTQSGIKGTVGDAEGSYLAGFRRRRMHCTTAAGWSSRGPGVHPDLTGTLLVTAGAYPRGCFVVTLAAAPGAFFCQCAYPHRTNAGGTRCTGLTETLKPSDAR